MAEQQKKRVIFPCEEGYQEAQEAKRQKYEELKAERAQTEYERFGLIIEAAKLKHSMLASGVITRTGTEVVEQEIPEWPRTKVFYGIPTIGDRIQISEGNWVSSTIWSKLGNKFQSGLTMFEGSKSVIAFPVRTREIGEEYYSGLIDSEKCYVVLVPEGKRMLYADPKLANAERFDKVVSEGGVEVMERTLLLGISAPNLVQIAPGEGNCVLIYSDEMDEKSMEEVGFPVDVYRDL
jgi:hypothetical protein